jgi:DNA-binding transcriptional ArsR family regulator
MTLMLHAGAEALDHADLRQLATPEATPTHVPIPHHRLVDVVGLTLGYYGHVVEEEHHGVTPDGMRYFGVLSLRSTYGDYTDTVGLRNSHDKTFPIGISFGSRVFVCDNLAFIADHVVRRKHTANARRDLPGLVGDLIEPLADQREAQHRAIARYRTTMLSQRAVDHAVLELYGAGVVTVTRIAAVMERWEHPP